MKIETPTGAAAATVAYFMEQSGIGAKLEALRQKYNGRLVVGFFSKDDPISMEVGGDEYLLFVNDMKLPGNLEVSYDDTKNVMFRIDTAEELYVIINAHLNRF